MPDGMNLPFPRSTRELVSSLFSRHKKFFVCAGTLCIVLIYLSPFHRVDPQQLATQQVCRSKECLQTSYLFLKSMDTGIRPCDDFYKFTCGKWAEVLSGRSFGSVDYPMILRSRKWKKMLELTEGIQPSDVEALQQLKKLYQSCKNTKFELVDQVDKDIVMELLDGLFLPGDSIGQTLAKINRELGVSLLFHINVDLKKKNNSEREIFIDQPQLTKADFLNETLTLNARSLSMDKILKKYDVQTQALAKKLGIAIDGSTAENILELDKGLILHYSSPEDRVKPENDRRLSLKELNGLFLREIRRLLHGDDYEKARESTRKIDWMEYLHTLFSGVTGLDITEDFTVNVRDVQYVEVVMNHLASKPISQIRMSIIGRLLLMLDTLLELASELDIMLGRSGVCTLIMEHGMPFAAVHQLAMGGDNKDKVAVEEMLSFVTKSFKSTISQLDWMDPEMKLVATRKVDGIKASIGYPTWLLNSSSVDEYYQGLNLTGEGTFLQNIFTLRKWRMGQKLREFNRPAPPNYLWEIGDIPPAAVNAFYVAQHNAILLPDGFLQFPYFESGISAIDYGSLGSTLGHEITHGFGEHGKHRDETGSLASWWNLTGDDGFKTKVQCFAEQYDLYWSPWRRLRFPVSGRSGNLKHGERTLEENIADNGGIRAAFEAFKMYRNSSGAQEQKLPGLEKYSWEQLYFLSFAHSHCGYAGWFGEDLGEEDPHAPNRIRVVGTLSNYDEFSRVWQCPLGSKINPGKKCVLWG